MNLSKRNAIQIVTEISGIINQHVNMMDENGMIIASTDPQRMGTYHQGSAKVIGEQLEKLVIWEDGDYQGAKKGINLPIEMDGEMVGVIGITGEHDEVVKYGQIIKKMTEILLLENAAQEQKKQDDQIKARFLEEWLFDDVPDSPQLIQRGARLGIDVTLPRRVLIAQIPDIQQHSDDPAGQKLIDQVNKAVGRMVEQDGASVFIKTSAQMICLLADRDDAKMRTFGEDIQRQIQQTFGFIVLIGIDERDAILHHAYLKAKKAFGACAFAGKSTLCFYHEVNLELFLDEISQQSKERFVQRMFQGFSPEEIASWVALLQVYFSANGSINQAADQLYIHKNTLQYKLRKLHQQTGYDPRNLSDAALFYMAIQFYRRHSQG